MKVEPLPPIPTPPAQLWRLFRTHILPGLAFLVVAALAWQLWQLNLANPLVVGTATGLRADVTSSQPGRLSQLQVGLYQPVRLGQAVAVVDTVDPQVLSNTVNLLRAQMKAVLAEMGYPLNERLRYAQAVLDHLRERSDLIAARAQLGYAQREFDRIQQLVQEGVASRDMLDIAQRDLEQARQTVTEKQQGLRLAEELLNQLNPSEQTVESPQVQAALRVLEEQIRVAEAQLQPLVLTAPVDGVVTAVYKLPGSMVDRAEPILTIASGQVEYIVGYVPQPLRVEPQVGMEVEVRTRGLQREVGYGRIMHVGTQIEVFVPPNQPPTMLFQPGRGPFLPAGSGLPIIVSVPPNLRLRPGELVDLTLATSMSDQAITQ
ncbi:MAG: hypothetical protein RMN51_03945 [Verrucomicrobiota bacterium]|nr:hypothetical protein [Limisphaera sp.]MDW8381249.1 hypothetical protein [Verrucomicrobiota bacterium]